MRSPLKLVQLAFFSDTEPPNDQRRLQRRLEIAACFAVGTCSEASVAVCEAGFEPLPVTCVLGTFVLALAGATALSIVHADLIANRLSSEATSQTI